ncbi:aldo/keto reductase [Sphingomonas sp. LB-2]|uniref:aldo/keto reductase n=1 Tax=Sphingomonas caeni TaxID=2984949 RepID=UPI0022313804|nr:aldo/keto reductase [Sphingomonas caeni]MCW3846132.1 aldo/keto reductase [Sphingomonas caeni]
MTETRPLGASGLALTPLVLGGNVFGWTADKAESFRILDRFAEAGGVMIDTADVYSAWVPGHKGGESETIIGEWLRSSGKRDKVLIATKVGMLPWDNTEKGKISPERIAAQAEASLARLGIDTIDLYFIHQDDPDTPQADVLGALAQLIGAGKVRAVGASNFSAMRLKSALDIADRQGLPHYRALQNEYNLVSRHKFEGELQDLCITHNIGTVPFYGLASGFLTGKYRSAADFGKSVRGGRMQAYLDGKGPAVLAAMDAVAAETGATLAQIALAWLAAQPGVTAPIASATSAEQLDELLGFWEVNLTQDQLDRLCDAGA